LDLEVVRRLWMRLGSVDPGSRPAFREQDVAAFELAAAGISFFNEDAAERFSMVVGLAVRRIAEAAFAMLIHRNDYRPPGSVIEEFDNAAFATTLLESIADDLLPVMVKHALEAATVQGNATDRRLHGIGCVGFCDLVGSTALLNADEDGEVMAALRSFERAAQELVVEDDGVLVKFVGDEVMWTNKYVDDAIAIGRALLAYVGSDPRLGLARVGIARGPLLQRDGDVFGPTVNRAARLVGIAEPNTLVADADAHHDGTASTVTLKGFTEPVAIRTLGPPEEDAPRRV